MQKFLTGTQLMDDLRVNRKVLALLAACRILNPVPVGAALVYDPAEIERLQKALAKPVDEVAPPAWIVRLSKPSVEPDDGHPLGWLEERDDNGLVIETQRNIDAARMYWRIVRPKDAEGDALVAVVGPLVVGVWQIAEGIFHDKYRRSEFIVKQPTEEQRLAYMGSEPGVGRWLPLRPGPTVLRWPLASPTKSGGK